MCSVHTLDLSIDTMCDLFKILNATMVKNIVARQHLSNSSFLRHFIQLFDKFY